MPDAIDQRIMGFIEAYIAEHQMAPTFREIAEAVERSQWNVRDRAKELVRLEYLDYTPGVHRSIRPGPRLRR